jgi:hypothetical protein
MNQLVAEYSRMQDKITLLENTLKSASLGTSMISKNTSNLEPLLLKSQKKQK